MDGGSVSLGRVLVSAYDKEGLEPLVRALVEGGATLLSTGGTHAWLESMGIAARRVEEGTGYPSILGGRVKTLHPWVFGGILARREVEQDLEEMKQYGLEAIDAVIVDLYPFARTLSQGGSQADCIEHIDIGGVSLLRAAAKNFEHVLVVSSSSQYADLASHIASTGCVTDRAMRMRYAAASFATTAAYEARIAEFMALASTTHTSGEEMQAQLVVGDTVERLLGVRHHLRYGENPHQTACFVGEMEGAFDKLHGKPLSYNNLLDLDGGMRLLEDFDAPLAAIFKHGTPCGMAKADTLAQAWQRALAGDPESAFGGVILLKGDVDLEVAASLDAIFFEVCMADSFSPDALELLARKKNRILLARGQAPIPHWQVRSSINGFLLQTRDVATEGNLEQGCVTRKKASDSQRADLAFAMRAVKHCKSNAIAIVRDGQLLAAGAGETSRVSAVRHAIEKAQAFNHPLQGAVLASDAFFPFPDSVAIAAEAGIAALVQPGGSVRDKESIDLCDSLGLPMYFTGCRHFKH